MGRNSDDSGRYWWEQITDIDMGRDAATIAGTTAGAGGQAGKPTGATGEEVVTQIAPVLMSRPIRSADPRGATVQWTDAVRGVKVDDIILVERRGVCDRVAVSLVTARPITDKYAGETVATVNTKTVTVGGSVSLTASDVGALSSTDFTSGACTITLPSLTVANTSYTGLSAAPPASYSQSYTQTMVARINDLYETVNALANTVRSLSAKQCGCNGCAKQR